jgi:cyclophilin family peptidyl-prolyl cis-trans isomerase
MGDATVRRALLRALLVVGVAALLACNREQAPTPAAVEPPEPPVDTLPVAVLRVREMGEIRIALRPDQAPQTVANFEKLAGEKFYEGITFHRVIPGFMIQTGDPLSKDRDPRNDGMGGPGYKIPDEIKGLHHRRGTVSMANAGPNTGGSQFFILVDEAPQLDAKHAVFGRVLSGMEVVDAIVNVERDQYGRHGPPDRPMKDVTIESVTIEPAKSGGAGAP